MATIPIHNPSSPFLGQIPGGLRVGSTLKIRAVINGFTNRLQINIQSGAALKPRDDVMLHISVRPQENCIVRNHLKNQQWGPEERHGGCQVRPEQSFEVVINCDAAVFRISINGQHHSTFTYRLPLTSAQYVSIGGTCTVAYITADNSGSGMGSSIGFPPSHINPVYPNHPRYPINHHPPAPPPMPMPIAPPPYPGYYPGHHQHHQHPTPYKTPDVVPAPSARQQDKKKKAKIRAAIGLSTILLSSAARRNR